MYKKKQLKSAPKKDLSNDINKNQNLYKSESGEPILKTSVVAFVDILGYLEQVKKAIHFDKGEAILRNLRRAYDNTYYRIKDELYDENYWEIFDDDDKPASIHPSISKVPAWLVKGFTDNIVIGYPCPKAPKFALFVSIFNLAYFQLELATHGFFIRGGVAIGDLYMDDELVFGEGLIEAYETERNLARDPRIVLSGSANRHVDPNEDAFISFVGPPQFDLLIKDRDGQIFINYLAHIKHLSIADPEGEEIIEFEMLIKHKEIVESKLREFVSEPAKWSKYFWIANYHNWFCNQSRYFNESHKIDLSYYPVNPSRIKLE